jgi:hypothetical protein
MLVKTLPLFHSFWVSPVLLIFISPCQPCLPEERINGEASKLTKKKFPLFIYLFYHFYSYSHVYTLRGFTFSPPQRFWFNCLKAVLLTFPRWFSYAASHVSFIHSRLLSECVLRDRTYKQRKARLDDSRTLTHSLCSNPSIAASFPLLPYPSPWPTTEKSNMLPKQIA